MLAYIHNRHSGHWEGCCVHHVDTSMVIMCCYIIIVDFSIISYHTELSSHRSAYWSSSCKRQPAAWVMHSLTHVTAGLSCCVKDDPADPRANNTIWYNVVVTITTISVTSTNKVCNAPARVHACIHSLQD